MTKVSAKKTAGVLGDDLALNTEQVSDIRAELELPVVWRYGRLTEKQTDFSTYSIGDKLDRA